MYTIIHLLYICRHTCTHTSDLCSHFLHRALHKEWLNSYESLTEMVVPRSTALIQEDQEFGLHTVTVFKKVVDEYKVHAREKR